MGLFEVQVSGATSQNCRTWLDSGTECGINPNDKGFDFDRLGFTDLKSYENPVYNPRQNLIGCNPADEAAAAIVFSDKGIPCLVFDVCNEAGFTSMKRTNLARYRAWIGSRNLHIS